MLFRSGSAEETEGRCCICNALLATAGKPQLMPNGQPEPGIVTIGDDVANIGRFCTVEHMDYSAEDVIRTILG